MGGRLVVFEGVEGAGKSTQLLRLRARIEQSGHACVIFREPGGTLLGDWIRDGVLAKDWAIDPRAEAHLFMASRAQLVAGEIRPALERGACVLLDRFFLSTYAYQIGGRGLGAEEVRVANRLATGGLVPDLTLLLAIPANVGLSRAEHRGPTDRMERAGSVFLQTVADAFTRFATPEWQSQHPEAGPIATVDAIGSPEEVEQRIVAVMAARLPGLAAKTERVA
ncbi:MAG: dTMP kinase [Gemmatimonadetes bacterium]|nr:dTMP kinase [Gemmatimonadota bacterium]